MKFLLMIWENLMIINAMELYTEIEFNKNQLPKIPKVLYTLGNEGWVVVDKTEFSITPPNGLCEIKAIKYKFRRIIE